MSVGVLAIDTKELSSVAIRLIAHVLGGPIGAEAYDAIAKKNDGSIDDRIAKIESARANLLEALHAIEELKTTAEQHQRELASLQISIVQAGLERDQLSAERSLLVQMTSADREVLRKALGYPSRLQAVLIWLGTFIFGAIATWLFTFAYDIGIKDAMSAGLKFVFGG